MSQKTIEEIKEEAYLKGMEDARNIYLECLRRRKHDFEKLFRTKTIQGFIAMYSPQEALKTLREYEKREV